MEQTQHKKSNSSKNVLIQGSILAAAGIITRIIGLAKKIPLAQIIGDVGNSYYSCAYEIYTIILMISTYSLPLAVSKMVSARIAKGEYKNARKVFRMSLLFAAVVGGTFSVLIFFFAKDLSAWFDEPMSYLALTVLAPTVFIVSIMGVFRGYFQGLGTMFPTAFSQVFEQIFVVTVSLLGSFYLMKYGNKAGTLLGDPNYTYAYGAGGAAIGPFAGALFGLLFLLFIYNINRKELNRRAARDLSYHEETYITVLKVVLLTALPVLLSSAIYNLTNLADQKLYHSIMIKVGEEATKSRNWGAYTGKYKVLISVPIAIANAMCSTITPNIAGLYSKNNITAIREKISVAMRYVTTISIPAFIGLATMARPIIDLLFDNEIDIPIKMMRFCSIAIVFYSISTLTNGILQGIGKLRKPVIHSAISLLIHCVLVVLLLYTTNLNIYAVAIADAVFALTMCIMNALSIQRELNYKQEILKTFICPLIAASVMGAFIILFNALLGKVLGNLLTVLIGLVLAILIYFVVLILIKGMTKEELIEMPYGRKLYMVFHKIHLL